MKFQSQTFVLFLLLLDIILVVLGDDGMAEKPFKIDLDQN
jgi:hypothetical protein